MVFPYWAVCSEYYFLFCRFFMTSARKMQNPFEATGKTLFEYAFSYLRQMARDAVDGRTINVVLCKASQL